MNKQENVCFHDDLLDREKFITNVFNPCCNILQTRGGVLAVHAPFGYGKSKFAQYYKEHLNIQNNTDKVIIIDAFLHDYIDDPFLAIHKSVGQLIGYDQEMHKLGREILMASAKEIFDLVPILRKSNLSNKLLKPNLEEVIKQYIERLTKLASYKPITIIIDELDRCRPDYAVHFLERVKHYFRPIPNVLFILMINKDQLFQSIGHVYGIEDKKDITNYFEKFLSYRIIDLPILSEEELKRGQSVEKESSYSYKVLYSKFQPRIKNSEENVLYTPFIETAAAFLYALDLNYRYHDQVYLGIEIILAIIKKEQFFTKDTARVYAYLLVLSLGRPSIFKTLKEGQVDGHKSAYDLFNEIESRFYEYGNHHIAIKDEKSEEIEKDIKGFFMFFQQIHYLAMGEENQSKLNKSTKYGTKGQIVDRLIIHRETGVLFKSVLDDDQYIRNKIQSWTNNIL